MFFFEIVIDIIDLYTPLSFSFLPCSFETNTRKNNFSYFVLTTFAEREAFENIWTRLETFLETIFSWLKTIIHEFNFFSHTNTYAACLNHKADLESHLSHATNSHKSQKSSPRHPHLQIPTTKSHKKDMKCDCQIHCPSSPHHPPLNRKSSIPQATNKKNL